MNVYQKLNAARLAPQSTKLSVWVHNKFAGYKYFEGRLPADDPNDFQRSWTVRRCLVRH